MQAADVKTRKLLTEHGGFHPQSSILKLNTKRREEVQELVIIRATIQEETADLQENIKKMDPTDDLLRE